jgi:hypothetical protein
MKLSAQLIRRVSAAAAVTAALLVPAVALAAPSSAAPARPAAAPGCRRVQLEAWIATRAGIAAGTAYFQLEISNISARTCTLYGFPGVSAVSASGGQLGRPAQRVGPDPVRLVTLVRGATAHVELGIGTAADYSPAACHPVTAAGLRVFAPGDFLSLPLPYGGFPVCQKPGPHILSVSPVLAGTGIPLFSH